MPILLVFAAICFAIASLSVNTGRINCVALGLLLCLMWKFFPGVGSL